MRQRRAFTLLELIVVIALLSVLAGVILPRMVGGPAREARLEALALRDLLTAAAERDALSSQPVALQFDDGRRGTQARFVLLTQREERDGDAVTVKWRPDPLLRPVSLERLSLRRATADTRELDRDAFLVDLAGSSLAGPRPSISLVLEGDSAGAWRIDLGADATAASLTPVDARTGRSDREPVATRAIDLDATGRSLDPW